MAERSLMQENPTVDEVVHLPAGITYWQKHTFRLYHHNPPLIKMIAALPVVWAQTGHGAGLPAAELDLARSFADHVLPDVCPPEHRSLFRAVSAGPDGHAAVFGARRTDRLRLVAQACTAPAAGFLSLCLWVFCPNILAHARLITTDLGSTAVGVAATYRLLAVSPQPLVAASRGGRGLAGTGPVDQVQHASALRGLAVLVVGQACLGRASSADFSASIVGRRPRIPDRRAQHPHDRRGLPVRRSRHSPGAVRIRLRRAHAARGRGNPPRSRNEEPFLRHALAIPREPIPRHLPRRPASAAARALCAWL